MITKEIIEICLRDAISEARNRQQATIKRVVSLQPEQSLATVITGVRRCGKSALLKSYVVNNPSEPILFLDFEDPRLALFKGTDFETLLEIGAELYHGLDWTKRGFVILLDEIQYVEDWERWVPFLQRKHRLVATGSNASLPSSELATKLTGRKRTVNLFPLSFAEVLQHKEPELIERIRSDRLTSEDNQRLMGYWRHYASFGGFPVPYVQEDTAILREYFSDIVQRDIVRRLRPQRPTIITEIGIVLASENTKQINKQKLAVHLGIEDENTLRKYIGGFEDSYLFYDIRNFSHSVRAQQRSLSKYYAVDPLIAQAVSKTSFPREATNLENFVFIELIRRGCDVFYYRGDKNYEIDFLVREGTTLSQAIQVCSVLNSSDTVVRETRAFATLETQQATVKKVIITGERVQPDVATQVHELDPQIELVPIWEWLVKDNG